MNTHTHGVSHFLCGFYPLVLSQYWLTAAHPRSIVLRTFSQKYIVVFSYILLLVQQYYLWYGVFIKLSFPFYRTVLLWAKLLPLLLTLATYCKTMCVGPSRVPFVHITVVCICIYAFVPKHNAQVVLHLKKKAVFCCCFRTVNSQRLQQLCDYKMYLDNIRT